MNEIPALIRVFSYLSILTVGGGMAAFPEMKILTVDVHKWMTFPQLIHLYSVGQMAPGPNMMMIVSIGQWAAGTARRDCCIAGVLRADGDTGVCGGSCMEEAGEMAVADLNSAGPGSGVDRTVAGGLFHDGQGCHYRPGNRSNCRGRPADPAALHD